MAHKTTTLELVGVLLPLIMDLHVAFGRVVVCETDSVSAVRAWWRGHSHKDELASTLVRAMFHITAAAGIQLYLRWIPRNSTPAAAAVDSLSKGSMEVLSTLPPCFTLPPVPRSLVSWLEEPCVDDGLGPAILEELARSTDPPNLLGYTV
jgi:hypothetical protein